RPRVAVDEDRTRVGEELDEAGVGGPNDVADRGRVLEARDADHDVGLAEPADLLADGLREARLRHGASLPARSRRRLQAGIKPSGRGTSAKRTRSRPSAGRTTGPVTSRRARAMRTRDRSPTRQRSAAR